MRFSPRFFCILSKVMMPKRLKKQRIVFVLSLLFCVYWLLFFFRADNPRILIIAIIANSNGIYKDWHDCSFAVCSFEYLSIRFLSVIRHLSSSTSPAMGSIGLSNSTILCPTISFISATINSLNPSLKVAVTLGNIHLVRSSEICPLFLKNCSAATR